MQDSAQSSPELTPFGKYLLDEEIARGGMARVYLARLRGLGGFEKKLVVKQVLPDLARDPRFVEMFVEEAKTLVQMSHPHIVPVYELGVVDGVYFLAMEHVEGATLAEILRQGPLEPPLAALVGLQVCEALQYAHSRFGLVHRDVTPRNVIVDGLGHVRLLDFGIAAKAEGMMEGEVFGSPGYMSPEQARGEPLAPRSDLFSLGAVLYEALAAEPAFRRDDRAETLRALEGDPPSLAGRDDVPAELATLVDELLRSDPEARPESAALVAQRLRGWLSGARPEGVAPELASRADGARERRNRPASERPPAPEGRRDPSGVVRSIATSVTLQKLLDDGDRAPAVPTATDSDHGTVPLPRRSSPSEAGTVRMPRGRDSEADRGTQPIEGRRRPVAGTEPAVGTATARSDAVGAPGPPARGRAWLWAGVAAVLVTAGVFGARSAMDGREAGGGTPEPVAEAPDPDGTESEGTGEGHTGEEPTQASPVSESEGPEEGPTTERSVPAEGTADEGTPPPAPAAAQATLAINSTPWATVQLDGRPLGDTPVRGRRVAPGQHTVVLENPPMGLSHRLTLRLGPGESKQLIVDLDADPPRVTIR